MSMTTELINRLRTNANWLDEEDNDERAIRKSMLEAADTIQLLSEKLHASQMEPFINKPCISEGVCREDKIQVLEKIKSELWMEGMNMTGEYQGVWVRYRDIERIIDKYMKEGEEEC